MITITYLDTFDRKQVARFLNLPFRLYADTPQWVPPLEIEARKMLDRKRNPFFKYGDAAFFLAIENGRIVGRLSVLDHRNYNEFNKESTAFFYLFECEDNQEISNKLFDAAFEWAKNRGLSKIIGPKGFTVFDGLGLLVRGFEHRPAFGLPYNLPYYSTLVEKAGFTPAGELISGYLDRNIKFPEKIHEIADKIKTRRKLHIVHFKSRRDLKSIIPHLKELYNSALGGTRGNTPLTDEDVKGLADEMLWFADPALVKIVMSEDKPIGFLLGYPDISEAVQKIKGKIFPFGWIILLWSLKHTEWINLNGAGIVEGYRGLGATAILFSEMYKSVSNSRYKYADIVQIGMDNDNMQREMRNIGIDFYKVHRMYQKEL